MKPFHYSQEGVWVLETSVFGMNVPRSCRCCAGAGAVFLNHIFVRFIHGGFVGHAVSRWGEEIRHVSDFGFLAARSHLFFFFFVLSWGDGLQKNKNPWNAPSCSTRQHHFFFGAESPAMLVRSGERESSPSFFKSSLVSPLSGGGLVAQIRGPPLSFFPPWPVVSTLSPPVESIS